MRRGQKKPAYDHVRQYQRVPVDTEVQYVGMNAIEDVKKLMQELQPRRTDRENQALLRICGRFYN